jgi:hypothetical protein
MRHAYPSDWLIPPKIRKGIAPMSPPTLYLIERFLRRTQLPPTKFGRLVAKDPRLVLDMRNGREVGTRMRCKIEFFINSYDGEIQDAA